MLSVIDRYIGKLFLAFFVGGLIVVLTIFLAADFVSSMSRFQAPLDILVRYYTYYSPSILYQMVPAGCLIATLFTFTHMNKNNELISLFSMGMSLARVSLPVLVLCALISVFAFWLGDRILPAVNQKKNYVYYVELRKRPWGYQTVKRDRIWYRSDNIIFNIRSLDAEGKKAQGVTMFYFDDKWDLIQLIKAHEVELKDREWDLKDGTVTLFAEESSFPLTKTFENKLLHMSEDLADISTTSTSELMSVSQLGRMVKKNREMGLNTLRYETDYYAKLAFACAGIVLSISGIPFTTRRGRTGGNMVSIAIAAGMAAGYWMVFGASVSLGYHGLVPPFLAAWGPNIVMLGVSGYFLLKSRL